MSDVNDPALRAEALESLLVEKGYFQADDLDRILEMFNERVGPMNGARVVARAWRDASFKAQLLADGTAAIESYGFEGGQVDKLVVVENTAEVHNVVVCTLCSCYPWAMLGLPPRWYKDPAYRSRVVREPRRVLGEFGLDLPSEQKVRVWDSSAEVRYMVLPQMPTRLADADDETRVAAISRDAMIGVALVD